MDKGNFKKVVMPVFHSKSNVIVEELSNSADEQLSGKKRQEFVFVIDPD